MVTDPVPRAAGRRREYEASDARRDLTAPPPEVIRPASAALEEALAEEDPRGVRAAGLDLLGVLSDFHSVDPPSLQVGGVRPHRTREGRLASQLYGDYRFEDRRIRVWMRTAVQRKVTSYRTVLDTLLHEYIHHLDVVAMGFPNTLHTRGFFHRVDGLYHAALDTPEERRRPLAWIKTGPVWRIDWRAVRG